MKIPMYLLTISIMNVLHPNEDQNLKIFEQNIIREVEKYELDCENYEEYCTDFADVTPVNMCRAVLRGYLCENRKSYNELLNLLHEAQQYLQTNDTVTEVPTLERKS